METYFCIYSYNSRGFHEANQEVCRNLLKFAGNKIPIICNQENFLLKENKYKIEQSLPDHRIYFKPAQKSSLLGRPVNGMFIAIPKNLKATISDVSTSSSRVQALVIDSNDKKKLLINTYFPQDPRTTVFDTSELMTTLATLSNIRDE